MITSKYALSEGIGLFWKLLMQDLPRNIDGLVCVVVVGVNYDQLIDLRELIC